MSRKKIQRGSKLFKAFNDRPPEKLDKVQIPEYEVLVEIGECTHIAYLADDGKNYIHRFKPSSRPVLAVTDDGKHLVLLGGKYRFTDRGIVDK